MVFVVRTDLSMTKGKMAAQCGHATLMCYKSAQKHAPSILERWERLGQAKIALKCSGGEEGGEGSLDGEEELETLAGVAASLGVVARIVRDAGRTQIKAGSATVLGVGPGEFFLFFSFFLFLPPFVRFPPPSFPPPFGALVVVVVVVGERERGDGG